MELKVGMPASAPDKMKVGMRGYLRRRLVFRRARDHSDATRGVTILGFGEAAEVSPVVG